MNTLTVWFSDPKEEYVCEETGEEIVLMKDKSGRVSDIDILVEFDKNHMPGLFDIAGMEIELAEMFGRKVDLRTPDELSRYFRDDVLQKARVEYAI